MRWRLELDIFFSKWFEKRIWYKAYTLGCMIGYREIKRRIKTWEKIMKTGDLCSVICEWLDLDTQQLIVFLIFNIIH